VSTRLNELGDLGIGLQGLGTMCLERLVESDRRRQLRRMGTGLDFERPAFGFRSEFVAFHPKCDRPHSGAQRTAPFYRLRGVPSDAAANRHDIVSEQARASLRRFNGDLEFERDQWGKRAYVGAVQFSTFDRRIVDFIVATMIGHQDRLTGGNHARRQHVRDLDRFRRGRLDRRVAEIRDDRDHLPLFPGTSVDGAERVRMCQ